MSRSQRLPVALPVERLRGALGAATDDDARAALELLAESLRPEAYERSRALRLLEAAGPDSGLAWEVRRLAALLLEGQLLKLDAADGDEWALLLARLGLAEPAAPGEAVAVNASVLKEGYTTTSLYGFVRELRGRLGRLARAHEEPADDAGTPAAQQGTPAVQKGELDSRKGEPGEQKGETDALLDLVHLSRRECKLTLARYLFRPEEVVRRILRFVRTSRGLPDLHPFQPPYVAGEAAHATLQLPPYESSILRLLTADSRVYWVSETTPPEINSLVEYPSGTVVLVVKPPGSCVEFEIKRAGRRGAHPLGAVYVRADGTAAPPSHRLDGGSAQEGLRYEAHMASRFSRVFRLAHGRAAPIPDYLTRVSIQHVPTLAGEAGTLDYFTDPRAYGEGFERMRAAMFESVAAFRRESGANLPDLPGPLGLTMHFLSHAAPGQAVLSRTTSYRLDRLASYLSDDGDEAYFRDGLKSRHTEDDARRFADEILDEVLCVYRPPRDGFRAYAQYLAAAFRVPANRARADENYLSALAQIGTFWGTLFAIRGHSLGESFVARNVGLRSVWEGGGWRLRVVFMDHDNLQTNEVTPADFQAVGILKSLSADDVFIWGELESGEYTNSESHCLEKIYRPGRDTVARGRAAFRDATLAAYRRTQAALADDPGFRELFHDTFAGRVRDWDHIIASYLRRDDVRRDDPQRNDVRRDDLRRGDVPGGVMTWREESKAFLAAKGYERELIDALLLSVETYGGFLKKYAYLFG